MQIRPVHALFIVAGVVLFATLLGFGVMAGLGSRRINASSRPMAYPLAVKSGGTPTTVHLFEPVRFQVAEAEITADAQGYPAVGIELADSEKPRFQSWTAERVRREIAVLVAGEVRTIATLPDPLPGEFQISGGSAGFSLPETKDLIALLRGDPSSPRGAVLGRPCPGREAAGC